MMPVTSTLTKYCGWVIQPDDGAAGVPCVARAVDGSSYCQVHRDGRIAALEVIVQAIHDMVDRPAGDSQERARCDEVCEAIYALVAGRSGVPLLPHHQARAAWWQARDEELRDAPLRPEPAAVSSRRQPARRRGVCNASR